MQRARAPRAGVGARPERWLPAAGPRRRSRHPRRCWFRSSIARRDCSVLLTQRSADLPDHPGQISFPGWPRRAGRSRRLRRRRCAKRRKKSGLPPIAGRGAWAACRLRNRDRLSRHAGRRLGRAAVHAHARSGRSRRRVRGAARVRARSRRTSSATSGCWANCAATSGRFPIGDRYIWGATAAMLLILDRTLRQGA